MHGQVVLLVDDDDDIREGYALLLHRKGFRVVTAASGAEALPLALEHQPAVIVMDLQMPGVNGFEATRALKEHPATAATPVLAFSSIGYAPRKAKDAGCDAFLRKAAPMEVFLQTIRRLIAERGRRCG